MSVLADMVSEIETYQDLTEACMVIKHHIKTNRLVEPHVMMGLAVKAHHVSIDTRNPMASWEFLQAYATEPDAATMVEVIEMDRESE